MKREDAKAETLGRRLPECVNCEGHGRVEMECPCCKGTGSASWARQIEPLGWVFLVGGALVLIGIAIGHFVL